MIRSCRLGFVVSVVLFVIAAMMVPISADAGCGGCQKCKYVFGCGVICVPVSDGDSGKECCDDSATCGTWGDVCAVGEDPCEDPDDPDGDNHCEDEEDW